MRPSVWILSQFLFFCLKINGCKCRSLDLLKDSELFGVLGFVLSYLEQEYMQDNVP